MLLKEISDYKSKKLCREYWPGHAYIEFKEGKWITDKNEDVKYDPEVPLGKGDADTMWVEWTEERLPPPPAAYVIEVVPVVLEKHPNADTLSIIAVKGWTCVVKTESFKDVKLAAYVPPDSVVPDLLEFRDHLGIPLDRPYRAKDFRIKCCKLRGVFSQGILIKAHPEWQEGDNIAEILNITKYEPPEEHWSRPGGGPCSGLCGDSIAEPALFHHYTKIERIENHPNVLEEGEHVYISEKIHGSSWRAALINGQFYVGSHRTCKKESETSIFWQMAKKYNVEKTMRDNFYGRLNMSTEIPIILFGEAFGGGIQNLKYSMTKPDQHDLRLFDISINGKYVCYDYLKDALDFMYLPQTPLLYLGPYSKDLLKLASGRDFTDSHYREGIVIKPIVERWDRKVGRVALKVISQEYQMDKRKTDFH